MTFSSPDSTTAIAQDQGALPPTLQNFQRWTLLLFLASVVFHFFEFLRHKGLHQTYPLARGTDRFYDFTIFGGKFELFHTSEFFSYGFPINYPAPSCVVYELFFHFCKPHALRTFVAFCLLSFIVPAILFARALVRRNVAPAKAAVFCAVVTLFSWPAVLLVDGANMEVLVWVALLVGMWAYATDRKWLAAAFFGVGTSVKLFPFVLFGLYVPRQKEWGRLVFGAFVFFAVSIISLVILGPTMSEAYRGLAFGMTSFKQNYMAMWRPGENGVDHSIFALYKAIMVRFFHHGVAFPKALNVYLALTAAGGLALYGLRIRFLPLLNQVLILTIVSIYLTAFSGDGTLIHLYYPTAMLLLLGMQADRDKVVIPGLSFMLGCLVFVLSFESFFVSDDHRFIGQVKCLVIGMLLVSALRYPLGPPIEENSDEILLSQPTTSWT